MSLNLLELPVEVLEEIFSYCVGSLLKLTETNSNLKDIIEKSPRLMKHIGLKVNENIKKVFDAFFNSTRKYQLANFHFNGETRNAKIIIKNFILRHANSLRSVYFDLESFKEDALVEVLEHCDYLENVDTFGLFTIDNELPVSLNNPPSCKFDKLKKLNLTVRCTAAFEVFQNCRNVENLTFEIYDYEMEFEKLYSMLANSREALKSLTLKFCNVYESSEIVDDKTNEVLTNLSSSISNLESLDLYSYKKLNTENVIRFANFLKTQKNLKKLTFNSKIDGFLLNSFKHLLCNMNLRGLELYIYMSGRTRDDLCEPWQLPDSLEILRVQSTSKHLYLVSIICHSPSQQLVELSLTKIDMNNDGLATITTNYPNLTSLKLFNCRNYSSDDIYLIFKHLKNLKQLNFKFPEGSILNNDLFTKNEDLQLPQIQEVCFDFNDAIDNYQIKSLMQPIKETSNFTVSDYYTEDILDIITRELVNLKELTFKKNIDFYMDFRRIKNNVFFFNKNPNLFKVWGKRIDCWLKEDKILSLRLELDTLIQQLTEKIQCIN